MRDPYIAQTKAKMRRKMKTKHDARTLIFNTNQLAALGSMLLILGNN